jgi:protein-disulfide isomerase
MKNINLSSGASFRSWPIRQIILGLILFGSGIAVGYSVRELMSRGAGSASATGSDTSLKDDPNWGPVDAKVTMVEFADFQCPYCRQWYSDVYGKIQTNYGTKIHFIFRDFPLSIHPDAQPAAVAADCAFEQGRYWEYFKLLYGDPRGVGSAMYAVYAQEAGLNVSKFNNCIKSGRYDKEIALDMQAGESAGMTGVPAFFINGRPISGYQPYEVFQKAIDEELSK